MAETATTVQASGRTGAICREAGPYRSSRNARVTVFLKPGDRFPADTDGAGITWALANETDDLPLEAS